MTKISNCSMIMTVKESKDRAAWLAARNKGIGGSDAGVIAGVNPWKSPFTLWMEKTGQSDPEDLSDNESVYWGVQLEPLVAKRFEEETGKKVHRCGMLQSTGHPWMLANVDRIVEGEDAGLEIKTPGAYGKANWDGDKVPDSYYIQCQHYMMVTGISKWYIACLIGGNRFVCKEIPRNEEDISLLFEAEKDFWERNVQQHVMPELDGSRDCQKALLNRFAGGQIETVDLPEAKDILAEYDAAEAAAKAADADLETIKNRLRALLGDNENGTCYGRNFAWKTIKGRTSIDSKKLQKDFPEAYEACHKEGKPTRRLWVQAAKEL